MKVILVAAIVLVLLLVNEWWWHGRVHGEASRKFVHITVGSFVALWPLLLTWSQIEFLSIAFVAAVVVSRQFNLFKAIHSVQRPTWGELYFGAAVGLVAVSTHQPAIYAVALLHMSLADGFAAVIGEKYGRGSIYRIFGAKKSRIGTLTFLVVSITILSVFSIQQSVSLGIWLPLIAVGATVLENIAVRGLDNITIPLYVALLLSTMR
jgi:phytol kinase